MDHTFYGVNFIGSISYNKNANRFKNERSKGCNLRLDKIEQDKKDEQTVNKNILNNLNFKWGKYIKMYLSIRKIKEKSEK